MRFHLSTILLVSLCGASLCSGTLGCSLINSLDDVNQSTSVTTGGGGGAGATGGNGGNGGGAVGGMGGSTSSTGGAGGTGGTPVTIESVVVVPGAPDSAPSDHRVLTLNGETGEVVSDEPLVVTSAAHDAARDIWFMFETSGDVVDPSTTAILHARSFDRTTLTWTELGQLVVNNLAPLTHRHLAVLNDKLTLAHYSNASPFPIQLSTIDTATPGAMTVQNTVDIEETDMLVLGVIGSPNVSGGTVNVVRKETAGGSCRVNLRLVNVVGGGTTVTSNTFIPPGTFSCAANMGTPPPSPGWAVNAQSPGEAVLLVPVDPLELTVFNMSTFNDNTITIDPGLNIAGKRFLDMDIAPCQATALFVEHLTDQKLYAVPLSNGAAPAAIALGHAGQSIVFDPFSNRALDFFDIGAGFGLTAYALGGTSTAPELSVVNQGWSPPGDFRPRFTVVRDSDPPCPN